MQKKLPIEVQISKKTYRAILHDEVRQKQSKNSHEVHHPDQKIAQIKNVLIPPRYTEKSYGNNNKILELFSGQGNLTKIYKEYGDVETYDMKHLITGDSYLQFHRLIYEKKKYDIVDIDPYGFPNRFFPDIFLLMNDSYFFVTFPKPYVNILNGITRTHLTAYYGNHNPTHEQVIERIATFGICHWREVKLIDSLDLKSVWRMAFKVTKVKATEYTNTKNR